MLAIGIEADHIYLDVAPGRHDAWPDVNAQYATAPYSTDPLSKLTGMNLFRNAVAQNDAGFGRMRASG